MLKYDEFKSSYKEPEKKVLDYLMYLVNDLKTIKGCRYLLFNDLVCEVDSYWDPEDGHRSGGDIILSNGLGEFIESIDSLDFNKFSDYCLKKEIHSGTIHTTLIDFFKSASDYKEVSSKIVGLYEYACKAMKNVSDELNEISTNPLNYLEGYRNILRKLDNTIDLINIYDSHHDYEGLQDFAPYSIGRLLEEFYYNSSRILLLKQCGIKDPDRKYFSKLDRRSFSEGNPSDIASFSYIIWVVLKSISDAHAFHLITSSYAAHKALEDYYEAMPGKIDALAEHFQECYSLDPEYMRGGVDRTECPIQYFEEVSNILTSANTEIVKDSQTQSLYDEVVNEVTSLLYKLKKLN